MYILALISALIQFSVMAFNLFRMKNKLYALLLILVTGVGLSIAVVQSLFLYSLCNRSIVNKTQ